MAATAAPGTSGVRATLDSVRALVTVLRAIHYREIAICTLDAYGLRVSVESSKSAQSHATLAAFAFRDY
ncbi:hypothetical protein HK405_014387, partial [Cladochytrium tenue]